VGSSTRQSGVSKSREILSIIEDNAEAAAAEEEAAAQSAHNSAHVGVLTRARKRKLLDLAATAAGSNGGAAAEAVIKRSKMDGKQALAKGGVDRQLRGTTNRRSSKGGKASGVEAADRVGQICTGYDIGEKEEAVIPHDRWLRERDERDKKYPATVCNKGLVR
jgi:hypothetical protein